jgi:predicted DCC family thiol-disulfide oxidoreductase YuxK
VFDFASLQSRVGRDLLTRFDRNPDDLNTFYVVADYRGGAARLLSKARAVLFVMKALRAPWRWLGVFDLLPNVVLDRGYGLIARKSLSLIRTIREMPDASCGLQATVRRRMKVNYALSSQ